MSLGVQAQRPGGGGYKMPSIGHVYGKLIDSKTKEALPYTSAAILKKDSIVAGCLTKDNGEYSFENLPYGKYDLQIKALGYKVFRQAITISPKNEEQDLGDIKLEADTKVLGEVEVVTEKSAVEMNIDRKVFNVDKNIVSKGGTASDVMKSIPSVTLDESGNAQLRQNAATIYVDGRPTTLTLDQIPADQIDKVEVITNPSAKFEASATGGIINIVMKANNKPGYNGIVTGGIGTNNHYNGMASINVKQKPIGFSITYNYNTSINPGTGYTNRTNLQNGLPSGYFNTNDNTSFQRTFQMGTASFDYFINNRNTLSLSETIVSGEFNNSSNQLFTTKNKSDSVLSYGNRQNPNYTHFENYTSKVSYKKTFPKKGREFTSDINFNTLAAHSPSTYTTTVYGADGVLQPANPSLQGNDALAHSQGYSFQADYINPINDSTKFETGVRSNYKPSSQGLEVNQFDYNSGAYFSNPFLTSHYKINDLVNGAYVNYSTRYKGLNYMLGLRFEDSYYKGILTDKNDSSFSYQYPSKLGNIMNALFPSIFISKKLSSTQDMQFNVSRKINRPNFRQLMPFIMAADPKDYSIGNPVLSPEFITMAEINYNQILSKGSLFMTVFYRNTQNPMTSYTYPLQSDASVLVTTTINGKQSNTLGMDNTLKYTLFKGFEATFNMNLIYTSIDASYNNASISNQGLNYTGKLNMVYHLPKSFNLQLSGNYESPKTIPQGTVKETYGADCGISKDIKKFITFTLSLNDIFDTRGRGTNVLTDQYQQVIWTRREVRFVKLTLMIRFGRADATMFKRKSQKPDDSDLEF